MANPLALISALRTYRLGFAIGTSRAGMVRDGCTKSVELLSLHATSGVSETLSSVLILTCGQMIRPGRPSPRGKNSRFTICRYCRRNVGLPPPSFWIQNVDFMAAASACFSMNGILLMPPDLVVVSVSRTVVTWTSMSWLASVNNRCGAIGSKPGKSGSVTVPTKGFAWKCWY
jgi:hypothetical protein